MQVIKEMSEYGHELIVFAHDKSVGLKAIIAIHSTVLGPALGGTRFWNYASEDEALFDVLRLSRGMTLKNAAAGLKHGGGKAVIIGDPEKLKSREFFHVYGKFIDTLGGKYYTAEDVNINASDIAQISETTKFVTGTPEVSGNPSPFTARGVYLGMKAGASVKFGSDSLKGKTVAVQGLGSVGYMLCKHLQKEGAKLKVYDINRAAMEKVVNDLGATAVSADEILTTDCDILSPCAMGAVLNKDNIKSLKCRLIAGAANNVLMDALVGDALNNMNILYLPDYIINAGGVINCGMEIVDGTYNVDIINAKVDKIYDTTLKIIALAKEKQISTYRAADEYAESIINAHKK
ncbi:MAG: NAD(P)-binding domain-containing protein [Candidatus Bathyarchaeota archaeon]|nr:NAD(P)-binding domain-containing protein [Candidatus Termiticorpusculum sp.]